MKYFTRSVFFFCLSFSTPAFTQADTPHAEATSVFKLNFFLPGISYEQKLSAFQTLYSSVYLDALFANTGTNDHNNFEVFLTPSFNVEFRNYYNLNKRARKGLRTDLNSASYVAPVYIGRYSHLTNDFDKEWVSQVGAVWGIQHNTPGGFGIDLNLGMAYTFNTGGHVYYQPLDLIFQLSLGFWMGKKENKQ
jgi:hypothetical protein